MNPIRPFVLLMTVPSSSQKSIIRSATRTIVALITLVALFGVQMSAQEQRQRHRHYKFVDLGTLGGPHSYGSVNGDGFGLLNNSGVVASFADTDVPDPNAPDLFLVHASKWENGVITEL